MTAVTTMMMAVAAETTSRSWMMGVPTKLVKKATLVPGAATMEALEDPQSTLTLPVYTLTFEIPTNRQDFTGKAQSHDTLRIELGDVVKMVIPGYKPKSYSMSALRETEFDITLKVYPNGRASGYLDRLRVGDTIATFGLHKQKIRQTPVATVCLIAYGVGITEAWPIAKAELDKQEKTHANNSKKKKVILLWASRTQSDTFWKDEMEYYQTKYPDSFQLVHIFSRQHVSGCLHGRINPQVLANVFNNIHEEDKEDVRFLSVGTKSMMAMTDRMLESIGFQMPKHALLVSK